MLDEEIILNKEISIDNKHRIAIPKEAEPNDGDIVCLIRENDLVFRIQSFNKYSNLLKKYRRLIMSSKDIKSKLEYENLRSLLTLSLMGKKEVDSINRIIIPEKVIEEYDLGKKVIVTGGDDHIKVFKNDDTKKEYMLRLQEKYGNLV